MNTNIRDAAFNNSYKLQKSSSYSIIFTLLFVFFFLFPFTYSILYFFSLIKQNSVVHNSFTVNYKAQAFFFISMTVSFFFNFIITNSLQGTENYSTRNIPDFKRKACYTNTWIPSELQEMENGDLVHLKLLTCRGNYTFKDWQ